MDQISIKLHELESKLDKRCQFLVQKISKEKDRAKACGLGNKPEAVKALRRVRQHEGDLEKARDTTLVLHNLSVALDHAEGNAQVLRVIQEQEVTHARHRHVLQVVRRSVRGGRQRATGGGGPETDDDWQTPLPPLEDDALTRGLQGGEQGQGRPRVTVSNGPVKDTLLTSPTTQRLQVSRATDSSEDEEMDDEIRELTAWTS